jgi:hypothetical protein
LKAGAEFIAADIASFCSCGAMIKVSVTLIQSIFKYFKEQRKKVVTK